MGYDYNKLCLDLKNLTSNYDFIFQSSIGKSVMGKDIPVLKIGNGKKKLLLCGAYHGLEYITSAFLMKFIATYTVNLMTDKRFLDYDVKKLYKNTSLYIVPMVNVDGVDIAIHGLDITNPYHRELISAVGIHSFNNVWQANARGVDLNHNYDADWEITVASSAPTKYGGECPESEPETKALVEFMKRENFDILLAFHSQGGEIYYDFKGMADEKSKNLALQMAAQSGYTVCEPTGTASYGGCKDWFIKTFGKSGFTVEMGKGKNPLPLSMLDDIFDENAKIILLAMSQE